MESALQPTVQLDDPSAGRAGAGLLTFRTVLIGSLDGRAIELHGQGYIHEGDGFTDGTFDLVHLPEDVEQSSLCAFLFTGYPNSCRTQDAGVGNPFSGGDYTYEREYAFARSGQRAILEVTCKLNRDARQLISEFRLNGSFPDLGGVSSVSPIYELWTPHANLVEGAFHVAWVGEGASTVVETAVATSVYHPVNIDILRGRTKHRFLQLDSKVTCDGRLHVRQRSNLLDRSTEL